MPKAKITREDLLEFLEEKGIIMSEQQIEDLYLEVAESATAITLATIVETAAVLWGLKIL